MRACSALPVDPFCSLCCGKVMKKWTSLSQSVVGRGVLGAVLVHQQSHFLSKGQILLDIRLNSYHGPKTEVRSSEDTSTSALAADNMHSIGHSAAFHIELAAKSPMGRAQFSVSGRQELAGGQYPIGAGSLEFPIESDDMSVFDFNCSDKVSVVRRVLRIQSQKPRRVSTDLRHPKFGKLDFLYLP